MKWVPPALVLVAMVAGLVVVANGISRPAPAVMQPIAFNHQLHLEKADLQCADCHTDAGTQRYAGLPGKDACFDCHDPDDEVEAGSELAKLIPYADSDQEIPWARVAVTRHHVFFSHRRHVTSGGIDCQRCHVNQQTLTAPPRTAEQVMTMVECMACHEENRASTDCLACHR